MTRARAPTDVNAKVRRPTLDVVSAKRTDALAHWVILQPEGG